MFPLRARILGSAIVTFIPDLSSTLYSPDLHRGANAVSVGWLGRCTRPWWKAPLIGTTKRHAADPSVLALLSRAAADNQSDCVELGLHTCETCGREESSGEFWFEWDGVRYVLPNMVFHYIDAHGYSLPSQAVEALRNVSTNLD